MKLLDKTRKINHLLQQGEKVEFDVVAKLLQKAWLAGNVTVGVGLTVMVKLCVAPLQLLATGVTVMVATIGALVLLVAVNEAILPEPLAPIPMAGCELVQLKVVPATSPEKANRPTG